MATDVQIKEIQPQKAIMIRVQAPYNKIGEAMERELTKIMGYLDQHSISPQQYSGPAFVLYHSTEDMNAWDYSLGIPIEKNLDSQGEIKMGQLPGGKVAVTSVVGSYDNLKGAWEALTKWIEDSQYNPAGEP